MAPNPPYVNHLRPNNGKNQAKPKCLSNLRKNTPETPKSSVPVLSAQKPLFFWQIFIQIIVSLSVHIARLCWTVDSKSRLKVPLPTDAWELNAKTVRSIGKDARRRVPSPHTNN